MGMSLEFRRPSTCRRAISLVEVVLAIVILGLAIPPIVIQMTSAAADHSSALVDARLARLANARINEIALDLRNPARGFAHITTGSYPDEMDAGGLKAYSRVTTIREVSDKDFATEMPGSGLKRIVVSVSSGTGEELRVETLVSDLSKSRSVREPKAKRERRDREGRAGGRRNRWS